MGLPEPPPGAAWSLRRCVLYRGKGFRLVRLEFAHARFCGLGTTPEFGKALLSVDRFLLEHVALSLDCCYTLALMLNLSTQAPAILLQFPDLVDERLQPFVADRLE